MYRFPNLFLLGLCSAAIVALLWLKGGLSLGSSIRAKALTRAIRR